MLAVAATCLVAALVAAPTAGAASAKASANPTAKASVTKKRLARDIRTVRRRTNAARRSIRSLGTTLASLQGAVTAIRTAGEGTQGQLNGVLAAVPTVLDALTQLRDGSLALRAGLETLAAKTTEGFNTVSAGFDQVEAALTTVATSQEYGVTGLFLTFNPGSGDITVRGPLAGSADIPDDGNSVAANGTVPITISGTPNPPASFPAGTRVSLRSAIRSGEAGDGDATGDPAGQVGGLMYVKDASNATGAEAAGTIICSVGPTAAGLNYDPPGEGLPTTLPLKEIQVADDRTDQTAPSAGDVNPISGATATPPLGDSANGTCTLPAPGVYEVTVQTQYVDLPTSEDPDADD